MTPVARRLEQHPSEGSQAVGRAARSWPAPCSHSGMTVGRVVHAAEEWWRSRQPRRQIGPASGTPSISAAAHQSERPGTPTTISSRITSAIGIRDHSRFAPMYRRDDHEDPVLTAVQVNAYPDHAGQRASTASSACPAAPPACRWRWRGHFVRQHAMTAVRMHANATVPTDQKREVVAALIDRWRPPPAAAPGHVVERERPDDQRHERHERLHPVARGLEPARANERHDVTHGRPHPTPRPQHDAFDEVGQRGADALEPSDRPRPDTSPWTTSAARSTPPSSSSSTTVHPSSCNRFVRRHRANALARDLVEAPVLRRPGPHPIPLMAELSRADRAADPTTSRRPRSSTAHPVAEFERLFGVVRREQHRAALAAADLLAQKRAERARQNRIEPARRLVEQQNLRSRNERSRDQQPLLHARRKLPHQLGAGLDAVPPPRAIRPPG